MGYDAFISYSSKDKHVADAVCAVLESESIRCWIAPRDIRPGADWGESIIDAIYESKTFVLVFSENANTSVQIKREVERAVNKGIPVIPFRVQDVMPAKSLEYFLSTPHWLDAFTPPMERHIRYLADTIKSILPNSPVSSSPPLRSAPPQAAAGLQLKAWQLGAGAAAVALLAVASAYVLPAVFSPRQQTVADVSRDSGQAGGNAFSQNGTAKTQNGSDQSSVAGQPDQTRQLTQTHQPDQPDRAQNPQTTAQTTKPSQQTAEAPKPSAAPASFSWVGRWRAEKIIQNTGSIEQQFSKVAFGEVLLAAFTGPGKAAELEVDGAGRATYTMSGQDRGAVTNAGTTLTFISAANGKSSTVQVNIGGPNQGFGQPNGLGSPNGQFSSDLTWHFLSPQRSEMIWLGNIPGGSAQALLHYATPDAPGQVSGSRELKIFGPAGNQYELSVKEVAKGTFQTQSDQWTLTPDGAPPSHGTFRFEDKDTVTASSDEGTITWKRVN